MPAVEDTGVGKDHHPSGRERGREIPFAPALQPFERSALPHLGMLAAVELVDLLLEPPSIEGCGHGRDQTTGSRPADRRTPGPRQSHRSPAPGDTVRNHSRAWKRKPRL